MNFCVEEKLAMLKKPIVKNRFSWNMGIYKDSSSTDPEIELNVNKNTEIKLLTVAVVIASVLFVVCLCHKMSKMHRC